MKKIEFMLQSIYENLNKLSEDISNTIKEVDKQKINDIEMLSSLHTISKEINRQGLNLKKLLNTNIEEYNAVDFLNKALQLEYNGIFDYQRYASAIEDNSLKEKLYGFGLMEMEHASLLADKITSLGGNPIFSPPEFRSIKTVVTIKGMLTQHKEGEYRAIALFEEGLKHISDPELSWFIGRLRLDELGHLKEIDNILETYKELEAVITVLNKVKWHDDYVDKDKDRPWIEG